MESLKAALFPLLIIFALAAVVLIISVLRNRVMFKIASRNIPRRPVNTVLTCLGLMLAAMIFSASFATGDTLTHSIRSIAVDSLGETDIMVMKEGVDFGAMQMQLETTSRPSYFAASQFDPVREALSGLIDMADGDARAALNNLEIACTLAGSGRRSAPDQILRISLKDLEMAVQKKALIYDKGGEEHYNLISALHKSLRGSDPDAALYWLARMLDAGEDPFYIARRMVRFASEDVGNADP